MTNSSKLEPKSPSSVEFSENEITLKGLLLRVKDVFLFLQSKIIIIIITTLIGCIIGVLYSFNQKFVYTASTTFVLEEGKDGGGLNQYAGIASMVGVDLGGGGGGLFQGDNILELYKSRTMVQNTLLSEVLYDGSKNLLIERYIQINGLRAKWAKDPIMKDINFTKPATIKYKRIQDSLIGEFVSDINKNYLFVSKPDKKLSIIQVDVKARDELFAMLFDAQIVKNVNDFYIQTKTKKSLVNLAVLQHQTDSVRNVLEGAIYSSAAVNDATPNLNPTRQILRAPAQRSLLNAEANKAILSQLVQNLELSKMSLRKEMPLIQVIDQPIAPLRKEKLGKLKSIIIGGFVFGFISIFFLIAKWVLKGIMD